MRIIVGLLFILSSKVLNSGSKEHVHFKIYVPEIINHQVHTKTILIHVHKLVNPVAPKKPEHKEEAPKTHKEAHHEDWSSWRAYGYRANYHNEDDADDLPRHQEDIAVMNNVRDEASRKKVNRPIYKDSYLPVYDDKFDYMRSHYGDAMGYPRAPHYEVQENVKENEPNVIDPDVNTYEEGYRRGGESANGHLYSDDVTKFYEEKREEGDRSVEEYKNESVEKTDAGRYLVDDSEYQRENADIPRAQKRMFPVTYKSRSYKKRI